MKIKVFDSILLKEQKNFIESKLIDNNFPYYNLKHPFSASPELNYPNFKKDLRHYEYLFLVHVMYKYNKDKTTSLWSKYAYIIDDLLRTFTLNTGYQIERIFRAKVNFQTQCNYMKEGDYNTPHNDMEEPHQVLLYYANNTDGPTYFFDDNYKIIKIVEPKRGRFILFDGKIKHTGSNPYKSLSRIGINMDLKISNYDSE